MANQQNASHWRAAASYQQGGRKCCLLVFCSYRDQADSRPLRPSSDLVLTCVISDLITVDGSKYVWSHLLWDQILLSIRCICIYTAKRMKSHVVQTASECGEDDQIFLGVFTCPVLVLQLWMWSWWSCWRGCLSMQPPWIQKSCNSLYGPYLVMYKQWHWGREGISGCTWAPLCDDVSGHSEDSWHVSVITSLSLLSLSHYMLLLRQGLQSKGLFFFLRKVWTESV